MFCSTSDLQRHVGNDIHDQNSKILEGKNRLERGTIKSFIKMKEGLKR